MKQINKYLSALIEGSKIFGLNEIDLKHAKEFLKYNEFELSFDTIITQLYEYDIKINNKYHLLISEVAGLLQIPLVKYSYVKEIISEDDISEYINNQIEDIISKLDK